MIGWRSDDADRRAGSFDAIADAYEEFRPGYPDDVVAWLVDRLRIEAGTAVADVGAGTGQLARALADRHAAVVAVDPGAELLAVLRAAAPEIDARRGAAEELPLESASVDAVTVAQAYHWLDPDRALPELHRVLRPGGRLAILWTWWDEHDERQRPLAELTGRRRSFPALPGAPWFAELERTTIPSLRPMTREALVGRFTTSSAYAVAEPIERARLLTRIDALAATFGDEFELSQLTHVFLFGRLEPGA